MAIIPRKAHAHSPLANLAPADRQRLLDLLSNHGYREVRELAAKPVPERLGLRISHGALVRFHQRIRQEEVLAKLDETGGTLVALVSATPIDLAALNQSTRALLHQKTLEAVRDENLSINDNPTSARMALKLAELELRGKEVALRQAYLELRERRRLGF